MKIKLTFLFLLFLNIVSFSQTTDYNKIIMPSTAEGITLEERLVQVAWQNHPLNEMQRRSIRVAELDVKNNRWSWLDNIALTGNLNEFNLDESRDIDNRSQFFPRYNVSARISLGMFVSIPIQTKMSREKVVIEQQRLKNRKLEIRAEVLRRYNDYKIAQEAYKIQSEIIEDAQTTFSYFEEQFKNGEIPFERYSLQKTTYNQARLAHLDAKRVLEEKKITLEQILGIPLEDLL